MSDPLIRKRLQKVCFVRTGQPTDGEAFDRAVHLCRRSGAELSIVRVTEEPSEGILGLIASWSVGVEAITDVAAETAEVGRLVEAAARQDVRATGEVLRGSFVEIIRKVLDEGHDLLIKAAEPSLIVREMFFGRLDRLLLRKCPCPVWIERPALRSRPERVLAAVDPDPFRDGEPDPMREALNVSILQMACYLAEAEGAELHVAHVWPFHLESPLMSRGGLSVDAVAQVGESIKRRHEQELAKLTAPFAQEITREHLLKGNPGEEIVQLAAREPFDVIVMGTVSRTGVMGMLMGGTTETVLDQVACSVVALKPSGFTPHVT